MRYRVKEKNWLLIVIMGILSGYLLTRIWMYGTIFGDNDISFWSAQKTCLDSNHMEMFFSKNREMFRLLEIYFYACKDWEFGFDQFSSARHSKEGPITYYYRADEDIGNKIIIEGVDIPEKLADFLEFAAEKKEICGVVLHGDDDLWDFRQGLKRYLEVRCFEGEQIVSFIYLPWREGASGQEEGQEQIRELEDGWYWWVSLYSPVR